MAESLFRVEIIISKCLTGIKKALRNPNAASMQALREVKENKLTFVSISCASDTLKIAQLVYTCDFGIKMKT